MLPTICPILSTLSWSCKSLQGSILLVAHTLTFVQLGVWGQDLYSFVFPLHYNFNNLRLWREFFTVVQYWCMFLMIFIFHYSFQGAIGEKKKKKVKTKSTVFTSLLCLEVPWSILKKKIFENTYSSFHNYLPIQLFYLLLRQLGQFICSEKKKRIFFIGIVKFNDKELYILFANDIQISTLSVVIPLSYFSFSKSLLFSFCVSNQSNCTWFIKCY